jgi:hypothetical protein
MPSSRLIAGVVNYSHTWVESQLATVATWKAATKRTGKDGKVYTVPPPRPKTTVPPPTKPVAVAPVAPVPPPPSPKPEPPVKPVDAVGRVIPDYLLPTWRKAETDLGDCLADLRRIRRLIDGNPQMVEGHQGAVAGIETAASAVKAAIPYAVCPACRAAEPMQVERQRLGIKVLFFLLVVYHRQVNEDLMMLMLMNKQ